MKWLITKNFENSETETETETFESKEEKKYSQK